MSLGRKRDIIKLEYRRQKKIKVQKLKKYFERFYWRVWLGPILIFWPYIITIGILVLISRRLFSHITNINSLLDLICFETIGIGTMIFLWSLVFRYKKIAKIEPGKITKWLLIVLTFSYICGSISAIVLYLSGKY